jgi:hypothetical protein
VDGSNRRRITIRPYVGDDGYRPAYANDCVNTVGTPIIIPVNDCVNTVGAPLAGARNLRGARNFKGTHEIHGARNLLERMSSGRPQGSPLRDFDGRYP